MTSEYYDVCFVTMVLAKEERRWSGSSGATARRSCSSSTLLMASSNYTESCSSLRTCTCDLELDRWATNNVNFYKEKSSSNSLIYKTGFVYVFVFDSVFPLNRLSIASKSRRKTAENSVQFWREKINKLWFEMKNLKFWIKGFFKIEGIVPTLLERLSWLLVCWGEWDIGLVARGRSATRAVPALVKGRPTWRVRSSPSLLGSYLPRPLSLLYKPEKVQGDS